MKFTTEINVKELIEQIEDNVYDETNIKELGDLVDCILTKFETLLNVEGTEELTKYIIALYEKDFIYKIPMFNMLNIKNTVLNGELKNIILDDCVILADKTVIKTYHEQDCCENNYADFSQLKDTTFENIEIYLENLIIESCKHGFTINGHFVPCYSSQNGYYSSNLDVIVNEEVKLNINCEVIDN